MKMFMQRIILQHLSTKLVITILMLLLLSISLISFSYYHSASKIIGENVRASTKQAAKQSADYLSLILTVGSDMGQQIFRDASIQSVIYAEERGNLTVDQKFNMVHTVNQLLNNVMYTSSFVRSIYLLKEHGDSWGSGLFNVSKVKRYTLKDHHWYTNVVSNKVDDLWLPLQYDPFSGGGENTELVLSLVKPLRDLQTRQTLGVIVINMNGNEILKAIQRVKLGKTGKFFVIDPKGTIMVDADAKQWNKTIQNTPLGNKVMSSELQENEFEMSINGVQNYVITRRMNNGWTIIGMVPIQEIIGDIQQIQSKIWIYATVLLLLASVIGYLFSNRITSPLKELMKQMSQIEQSNFKARTHVRSRDEIGKLSHRFNKMVGQIETLIDQVNVVESKKREAEIRALRHQINPHFLYNTLSTIRWMIKLQQFDGAYNGIAALVQLMESSMEKQGVFSTIGEELALLEKYMQIQNYRYGNKIALHIHCEASLLGLEIPRMLLQPIIENAIFHGLASKEEGGTIQLLIRKVRIADATSDILQITIQDDGLGIPQDQLEDLIHMSKEHEAGMFGIGLMHVHEMIQLYYGKESGVTIESNPGHGTKVQMNLVMEGGDTAHV